MDPDDTRARRPCCGACRMPTLSIAELCRECGTPWDGSEVSPNKLPEILEQQIAAGLCTREEAFEALLRLDDLAVAAAKGEITFEQGRELVELDGLRVGGKARAQ